MRTKTVIRGRDSYMDLITEFPLRRLKSRIDYQTATKRVLALSSRKLDRGSSDYLDVLVDLISEYEKRSQLVLDTLAVSAADLIRHRIDQRGVSVSALAREIEMPQSNLSEMLSGKREWSKFAIRALSEHLNIRAERFLQ